MKNCDASKKCMFCVAANSSLGKSIDQMARRGPSVYKPELMRYVVLASIPSDLVG